MERWVEKLRSDAASFSPPPTAAGPAMKAAEVPAQLLSCKYMYVRGEGARPLLVAKYDGPFLVVAKAAKYFKIQRGTRVESVTVDRLETHLGSGPVAPASPPARRWPRKAAQNEEDVLWGAFEVSGELICEYNMNKSSSRLVEKSGKLNLAVPAVSVFPWHLLCEGLNRYFIQFYKFNFLPSLRNSLQYLYPQRIFCTQYCN